MTLKGKQENGRGGKGTNRSSIADSRQSNTSILPFLSLSKGVSFSLNLVVILGISILVLVTLGLFFASSSFGQMSEADAQRIFSNGCARYCQSDLDATFDGIYNIEQNDPNFVSACLKLRYGDAVHISRCLEKCSNCNLNVNTNDLDRRMNNIDALLDNG